MKQDWKEKFEKEFPKLMISINRSTWGDRTERQEGNGELMKKYIEQLLLTEHNTLCEEIERMPTFEYDNGGDLLRVSRDDILTLLKARIKE